jgi:AraC-like DNA-binding protein
MSSSAPGSLTFTRRAHAPGASLYDACCTLGPDDAPYPERHDGWAISVVRRGEFSYRASDETHARALRSGWMLLGRADHEYECAHHHTGGDDCTVLTLRGELLEDVARNVGARGPMLPMSVAPPVAEVAARMHLAWRALDRGASIDVDALAVDVATALLRALHGRNDRSAPEPATRSTDLDRVRAAMTMLDDRCDEKWSLTTLARTVGSSAFHFARLFRRIAGVSPHQYLLDARLRRASALLVDTDRPVTDVALDVGFDDLSNFVRTFHKRIGRSPGTFRRAARA